jgi:hypothetical protein
MDRTLQGKESEIGLTVMASVDGDIEVQGRWKF